MSADKVKYVIETKTEDRRKKAATDASIYIKLVSDNPNLITEWILLDNWLRDDFEQGRWDTFNIQAVDVGLPKCIGLKIVKREFSDGWLCERVIVKYKNQSTEFLVYDWLITELWCVTGEECLPQNETNLFVKDVRKREIEKNRLIYQWYPRPCKNGLGWNLPRFANAETIEELPWLFHNCDTQVFNFDATRSLVQRSTLKEYLSGKLGWGTSLNTYEDYMEVLKGSGIPVDRPQFYERWQEDEEFGRSTLNGTNPVCVERVNHIPEGLHINDDILKGILDKGVTLKEACEAGRVYISDFRFMVCDLKRNIRKKSKTTIYAANSAALFYVSNEKKFLPIAIQLDTNDPEKTFTPNDSNEDWLLAKMYHKSVDVAIHEWVSHYLKTHAIMEPYAVSMFRNLSAHHPLYKLLRSHLRTVAAINTLARKDLLGPYSAANQCIGINAVGAVEKYFSVLSYEDLIFPEFLHKKGIDDKDLLPNYHYRDDALLLWKAVSKFVKRVINIYYENDETVSSDYELQSWVSDVANEGIGWQNKDTKGFPSNLTKKEDLILYITIIIFTCSVQHAAINFLQFEAYKVLPFTPGGMRLPPHKRGEASQERIMNSLPDAVMTVLQLGTTYLLSKYAEEDVFIGNYPEELFVNSGMLLAKERFRHDLAKIEEKIEQRNQNLDIPYTVLLPSRIPISIAS